MATPRHSIRKQSLNVAVDSQEAAFLLQARVDEINRRQFLPVMERVLNELDIPGMHARVSCLTIDLGRIPLSELDDTAKERLYLKMRETLEKLLHDLTIVPQPDASVCPGNEVQMELMRHYLLRGTMPYWAPSPSGFSLDDLFLELAKSDSAALVKMLRECARNALVRQRMVAQFSEPLLERLLHLLKPSEAALIIAYIFDLKEIHHQVPVLPLGGQEFARVTWLVVLVYVIRDAGSQFNRKSFVKFLLAGVARADGLSFTEIVRIFHSALEQTGKRLALRSSLPGIIRDIAAEIGADTGGAHPSKVSESTNGRSTSARVASSVNELESVQIAAESSGESTRVIPPTDDDAGLDRDVILAQQTLLDSLRRFFSLGGTSSSIDNLTLEELLTRLAAEDPTGLVAVVRMYGTQARARLRLVENLSEALLQELLHLLEPQHALLIVAYLTDIEKIHRAKPALTVSNKVLSMILWRLVLAYVLRDPGSQFNRRAFVKSLLKGMSEAEGLAYEQVLSILRQGLEHSGKRVALQSSLPMVIRDLVHDLDRAPERPTENVSSAPTTKQASASRETRGEVGVISTEADSSGGSLSDAPEFMKYDLREALEYYLRYGLLPWGTVVRNSSITEANVAESLARLSHADFCALLAHIEPEYQGAALARAVEKLPARHLRQVLEIALSQRGGNHAALLESADRFAATAVNKGFFYARLIAAVLVEQSLDLEEFADAEPLPSDLARLDLPDDPAVWEPHRLKSVIMSGLRSGDHQDKAYPPQSELLGHLVNTYPAVARHFLYSLRRREGLWHSLIQDCSPSLFSQVLTLARPKDEPIVDSFLQLLGDVPAAYRPGPEDRVRCVVLDEALHLSPCDGMGEGFFARVLGKLFEIPLAVPVCEFMQQRIAIWRTLNQLPEPQIAAFASAVEAVASSAATKQLAQKKPGREGQPVHFEISEMPAVRSTAWAFLLGNPPPLSFYGQPDQGTAAGVTGTVPTDHYSVDTIQYELESMIEESPEEMRNVVERNISDAGKRERWIRLLPESALARLFHLLEPRRYLALLDTVTLLGEAWCKTIRSLKPGYDHRRFVWQFLLDFIAQNREANRSTARLVGAFFEYAAQQGKERAGGPDGAWTMESLLQSCEHLAGVSGRSHLSGVLARHRRLLPAQPGETTPMKQKDSVTSASERLSAVKGRAPKRAIRSKTAFNLSTGSTKGQDTDGEILYVSNAGLVLAGTFLPHLFRSLNLLEESEGGRQRIRSGESASRAVHLTQYLADGSVSAAEPLLVLNKILCGLAPETPVNREIEMTDQERELCDQLLTAMIANWPVIANTSVAGLRETFLQREGKLEHASDGWRLQVQRKTLDVLVDQITWSMSVIYHRWMPEPVFVKW